MSEEIVDKAKKMGHVPKEEWKGDPDKWRPAEEFVERGEKILPIVKANQKKLEKKFADLQKDFDMTLKANRREVEEAKNQSYALAKAQYEEQVKSLEKDEVTAFGEGDAEKFAEIREEKKSLKEPEKPAPVPEPEQRPTPEFEEWSQKETWYKNDEPDDPLTAEMDIQTVALARRYPNKSISEIFNLATANVKKLHTDKFTNSRREEAQSVDGGEPSTTTSDDQSYASLPKSAKDSFVRLEQEFKAKGRKITKDQFAKDYHS